MAAVMEAWQRGYELEHLRGIVARFEAHNARALSYYSRINEARVAEDLARNALVVAEWGCMRRTVAKQPGRFYAYHDVAIGEYRPADNVVHAFTCDDPAGATAYLAAQEYPTWVWVWQEDAEQVAVVEAAGYEHVGTKVTAAAELRGLYFREGVANMLFPAPRERYELEPAELAGLCPTTLRLETCAAAAEVVALGAGYANHYSKYNSGGTWSALALRGYTADPAFIIKPTEMARSWQAKHAGEHYELQDTPLRAGLPACEELAAPLTAIAEVHRMRLMRLAPGGGELERHADLTDPDSGIADGRVARFHMPLTTNAGVVFGSWDARGVRREAHMAAGECWYLDTRKPHTAVNAGESERIHLVLDVVSNAAVRELLVP